MAMDPSEARQQCIPASREGDTPGGAPTRSTGAADQAPATAVQEAGICAGMAPPRQALPAIGAHVLESIDSGVVLIDGGGTVLYANARLGALLDADVRTWPGKAYHAVFPPTLAPLGSPGGVFGGDLYEHRGAQRRVLARSTRQVGGDDAIITVEVYSDVTRIYEMDRLKDDLIASAAHDLKTPVTAIKGYAQVALRQARKRGDARMQEYLRPIVTRSDELTYLMDTMLDMSLIQANRLLLDVSTFDLAALLRKALLHFEFDLQQQGRAIVADLPEQPIVVQWDLSRVERVLINLLSNAIKYSPDGGEVCIGTRLISTGTPARPTHVEISVTDHGIGVPPDERERIFERFYRTSQVVEAGFKGAGLGLYLCARVMEAHGGSIRATDALHGGQGTTIVVNMPLRAVRAGADAEAQVAHQGDPESSTLMA